MNYLYETSNTADNPYRRGRARHRLQFSPTIFHHKNALGHACRFLQAVRHAMENLIKLHKAQLASDRMSCHSATANQVRLVLHTAAFWLMHGVRAAIPQRSPLASAEFATIRQRLIKIGARVIEHVARIRVQLPTSWPDGALFRAVALGLLLSGP
jgi:Transposase DDE domain group 1